MVGSTRERARIGGAYFHQILFSGNDPYDPSVIRLEKVTSTQDRAALEKDARFLAIRKYRAQATLLPLLEWQHEFSIGARLRRNSILKDQHGIKSSLPKLEL